jgi:hypothetical protein
MLSSEYTGFRTERRKFPGRFTLLLCLSLLGFAVMGYHPGLEDDGIYLSAIKSDLNPALYPHQDSEFFRLQLEATGFDNAAANFVRVTHIPVAPSEMLWQLGCIALILLACLQIAETLFAGEEALVHWAGVAMVAAMFTLPVAGTALFLLDQHLHPRNVAAALILAAVSRILANRYWQAAALLVLAFVMHPIMAADGISFSIILMLALSDPIRVVGIAFRTEGTAAFAFASIVPHWVFESPNPLWKKALDTRAYYYLYKWTWYEWLGAIAPIALFWWLWRFAQKRNQALLARFALAVFMYAVFQQAIAMLMLGFPSLVRLTPLQPMRYLQLVYFFFVLIAGCFAGKHILKANIWRWAVFLLVFNGSMFAAQRAEFSSSQHIEWPGRAPSNTWIQAFQWIRNNTPTSAYFALDPRYLQAPGEDYHSFRALAERSQLADEIKDAAAVTQVPELGPLWYRQVEAQQGWSSFQLANYERLKSEFGTDWTLVSLPAPAGLDCLWHNEKLAVCRIP